MTLEFSLREHKNYADYSPAFTFSKASGTIVRQTTPNASLGTGYFFVVIPRAWLHGKYIRWRWQGYGSLARAIFNVWIYDGAYDRTSAVDFPLGAPIAIKGNGLLQTLDSNTGTFAMETKDIQVNVAGGSETDCTLMFALSDAWSAHNFWEQLDWVEINTGAGGAGPLYDEQFTDAVHMEVTGTLGDYGYISTGTFFDSENEELAAGFEVMPTGSKALPARFDVAQGTTTLPAGFLVVNTDSTDLPASFNAQVSLNLPAKFNLSTARFSLREHKNYAAFTPIFTFSKSAASVLRMYTATDSLGDGYFFVVVDRTWLNDKYVRFRWTSDLPSTLTAYVHIYDGAYDRSSNVDFPSGSAILSKGNGLLQTLVTRVGPGGFGWETIDVQASLDGGSEGNCTIFIKLHDNQGAFASYLDLDWLEINASAGGADTLFREPFNGAVVMELTGTTGDYGYISGGQLPLGGSGNLPAGFNVVPFVSQDLAAEFIVGQGSIELTASFEVGRDSENLPAEFIVQQAASRDLAAKFEIPIISASTELPAELTVRQVGSSDLLGELVVRHPASADLAAGFAVRRPGSEDLPAGFITQRILDLPGEFVVRRSISQNLGAEFVVRHSAYAGSPSQPQYLGKFIIRRDGSQELLAELIVRHPDSEGLPSEFVVRQPTSEDLAAGFIVRQAASQDLLGGFISRQAGSEDLLGEFAVRRTTTGDLAAEFIVAAGSEDLHGELVVRHPGAQSLPGELVVRHPDSQNLLGELVVRHPDSEDLPGELIVRHPDSEGLAAELIVRQAESADLLGELVVRHPDSSDLPGEFIVRPAGLQDLGAGFIVRQAASQDLAASFDGQVSLNLAAELIVRHSAYAGSPSQPQYLGKFVVRRDALQELAAELIITQAESNNLPGEFTVRPAGTQNLAGAFVVRQTGSQDLAASFDGQVSLNLPGEFISRQAGSRSLPGALVVRHPASVELPAELIIRRSASGDLGAEFISRQPGSQDLLGGFIIRQSASQDLAASFDGQVSLNLLGKFAVRHPWPLWTNRYWLNGIVQLEEANLPDSSLEEIITGVMNDIKTWLLAEGVGRYSTWTNIELTPRAIRRAATYGTVASLYARHIFGPKNPVIRLAPMDFKIFMTSEAAMEYWEGIMMRVLDLYLSSAEGPRIWIDTLQEDPVFTMDDIPLFTWSPDDYTVTV